MPSFALFYSFFLSFFLSFFFLLSPDPQRASQSRLIAIEDREKNWIARPGMKTELPPTFLLAAIAGWTEQEQEQEQEQSPLFLFLSLILSHNWHG